MKVDNKINSNQSNCKSKKKFEKCVRNPLSFFELSKKLKIK